MSEQEWTKRPRAHVPTALRAAIYARDGFRCVYCQKRRGRAVRLTLDHVVAHHQGGPDLAMNLVTACTHCNVMRGPSDVDAFAQWLRRRGLAPAGVLTRVVGAMSTPLRGPA